MIPKSIYSTGSDDEGDEYIPEDRETEAKRNRKTAQRVQTAILQELRQTLGATATLPEEAAKDLVLQVIQSFIIIESTAKHYYNSSNELSCTITILLFMYM